jgi:hypothetical protein
MSNRLFLKIAGVCAILAPLTMLAADLLNFGGLKFEFTLVMWLAFVFFVPSIFGMTYLAASRGSRLAIFGGASAFFGAMAGASMQVLFRVYAVLEEKNAMQPIELLQNTFKLIATTQMIGITYPLGLIILAFCLFRTRVVAPIVAILLALGALMFPVGRIGGFWWAVLGSDVLLLAAFGLIGLRMISIADDSLEIENISA